jgi:transcriptional regulator with XRE-family HTH domain
MLHRMVKANALQTRKSLGRQLKALREQAGLKHADVSSIASPSKMKRIERGEPPIRPADVRALCHAYGVDPVETERLVALSMINEQGWWETYTDVMPRWFSNLVELEGVAARHSIFEDAVMPGLFQTADYAREVIRAGQREQPDDVIERVIAARIQRQANVFDREPSPQIRAILGAGVLARQVGGSAVMKAQVRHLQLLNERPEVQIKVLPWDAGAHAAMEGAFTLLDFGDDDPSIAYIEAYAGARYLEQPDQLRDYRQIFEKIWKPSVPIEEYAP